MLVQKAQKFLASNIAQYGTALESAITRMRLVNGCSDTEVSFNYDSDGDGNFIDNDDDYNNSTSPSNLSCHVFHPNGAGQTPWIDIPDKYLNPEWSEFSGSPNTKYGTINIVGFIQIHGVGRTCEDTSCLDLILMISGLTDEICIELNNRLGVPLRTNGEPANDSASNLSKTSAGKFKGTYPYVNSGTALGENTITEYFGKSSACFAHNAGGGWLDKIFYHVLIAR